MDMVGCLEGVDNDSGQSAREVDWFMRLKRGCLRQE